MHPWRERGYVSDSEEEEELQETQSDSAGQITSASKYERIDSTSAVKQTSGDELQHDNGTGFLEQDIDILDTGLEVEAVGRPDDRQKEDDLPGFGGLKENLQKGGQQQPGTGSEDAVLWAASTSKGKPRKTYDRRAMQRAHLDISPKPVASTTKIPEELPPWGGPISEDEVNALDVISQPDLPLPTASDATEQSKLLRDEVNSTQDLSPLSSPGRSFPADSPRLRSVSKGASDADVEMTDAQPPDVGNGVHDTTEDVFITDRSRSLQGRSFRPRKAIQLRPYMIEGEQYRQTFKARGLRPVQIAAAELQHREILAKASLNAETQDPYSQSSEPDSSLFSRETLSPRASPARVIQPPSRIELIENTGDDFPDIDQALHRNLINGVQQGLKRRKLTAVTIEHARTSDRSRLHARNDPIRPNGSVDRRTSVYSEPPTPPATSATSSAGPPSLEPPRFRLPRGLTPEGIVTPRPSSPDHVLSTVSQKRNPRMNSLSPMQFDVDSGLPVADLQQSSSELSGRSDSEVEFQSVRKRIKGVLPASWLRFDGNARQEKSPSKRGGLQRRTTSATNGIAKGVAQKRFSGTGQQTITTPNANTRIVDLSSDSSTDEELTSVAPEPTPKRTNPAPQSGHAHGPGSRAINDTSAMDMEDNWVDPMLPSGPRPRLTGDRRKKRQARVTDMFKNLDHRTAQQLPRSNDRQWQPDKAAVVGSRSKEKRKRAPLLSIADASRTIGTQERRQPQFIRVAARQAKTQGNSGRHSPTRKTIRLATREDTDDALTTLHEWTSGQIVASKGLSAHASNQARMSTAPGNVLRTGPAPTMQNEEGQARSSVHLNRRRLNLSSHQTRLSVRPNVRQERPPQRNRAADVESAVAVFQVTTRPRRTFRDGQLETEDREFRGKSHDQEHPGRIYGIEQIFNQGYSTTTSPNLQLDRYLQEGVVPQKSNGEDDDEETEIASPAVQKRKGGIIQRTLRRKPNAKRVDVETIAYRQPSEPLPEAEIIKKVVHTETAAASGLQGLGPFGTRYATDFDVRPLEIGTFYHQNSFIGSGDLDDALTLRGRDLDEPAGLITIDIDGTPSRWSAWNEEVATALARMLRLSQEGLEAVMDAGGSTEGQQVFMGATTSILYLLRSLVRYCSGCLHFSDPIDRQPCLTHFLNFTDDYANLIREQQTGMMPSAESAVRIRDFHVDLLSYLICLNTQMLVVAQHPSISDAVRSSIGSKLPQLCQTTIDIALPAGCQIIRSFLEDMRHYAKRAAGVHDDPVVVKSIVVINHCLKHALRPDLGLSGILRNFFVKVLAQTSDVRMLDQLWYNVLSIQPLLEIDARGVLRPGARSIAQNDNWSLVKCILDKVFALYPGSLGPRTSTLNEYLRQTLARVSVLMNRWHWRHCDLILGTVYDFFAKRGLAHLPGEDSKGSPRFLDELDGEPSLQIQAADPAFHVFLKILATGLRSMVQLYPSAKIQRVAWRFIPNHGRTYKKDMEVRQTDLDALRNHHDLLCVLYWALPPGSRPRLTQMKDLVDCLTSHLEACRINIHAWKCIARHALAQESQDDEVGPLSEWFRELATSTVLQYRLARSEAEELLDTAHPGNTRSSSVFRNTVEMTVTTNQRRILGTLLVALGAMQDCIKSARTWQKVQALLTRSHLTDLFKVFDANESRTFPVMIQILVVLKQYLTMKSEPRPYVAKDSQQASEESQDYGDWGVLVEAAAEGDQKPNGEAEDTLTLQPAVAQFLSSCFGADKAIDDGLLAVLVDVWSMFIWQAVSHGGRMWSQFLDMYSSDSWFQLRDTDNVRKWTPYYLAKVLERDAGSFLDNRNIFLAAWITSLVCRESMLKFQPLLTTGLLNIGENTGLLENLPFAADEDLGRFNISSSDFRTRRLSLLGCILYNMHAALERANYQFAGEIRGEYHRMLKQTMTAMKQNYHDLQNDKGSVADPNASGNYVGFVQQVVSLMQQYTSDICVIDSFFKDSSAFPLPSTDPTYVVGRLKSYAPKLADARSRKQLAVFIQSLGQRAVVDNTQHDLVQQLHAAMTRTPEESRMNTPSLRDVFMTSILPAYIEAAFSTTTGWVTAVPLCKASTRALGDILYNGQVVGVESSTTDHTAITSILGCLYGAMNSTVTKPDFVLQPYSCRLLHTVFQQLRAIIVFVEYYHRTTSQASDAIALLQGCSHIGRYITGVIREERDMVQPDKVDIQTPSTIWRDTLEFTRKEVQDDLAKHWRQTEEGRIFVVRGNSTKEVVVGLGSVDEEKERTLTAIDEFMSAYGSVFGLDGRKGLVYGSDPAGLGEVFV